MSPCRALRDSELGGGGEVWSVGGAGKPASQPACGSSS
jgi:hypothetical protein